MNNSYSIRTFFIFLVFVLLYFIIILNLFLIQIINSSYYEQLATKQHNIETTMIGVRAPIFDRNGKLIATNKDSLSAFILPHKLEQEKELTSFLKKHFPKAYARLKSKKNKYFMYIKRKLTPEQLKIISDKNLSDIKILQEPSRYYPYESMGVITGVTDIDNNGLLGLELQFNKQLSGQPEKVTLQKDARSGYFYFTKKTLIEGKQGQPIKLTIDADLQFLVYEELQEAANKLDAKQAAAIIMDPENGQIISMTSWPTFNPNDISNLNIQNTKNNVITDVYEFGSVIKVFLMMAALEEKIIGINDTIDCENKKTITMDGMQFSTWKDHGILTVSEVVEKSNNIGVAKIAKKVGPKLYDHYTRVGFTKRTGIPLPGEQKGFITPPNQWSKWSVIALSFGYEISATLLQLAKAFCVIANGGYDIKPTLILDDKVNVKGPRLYSQETIDNIKEILKNTVTKGTAHHANIKGYSVMGKTGTANLLVDGKYCKEKNIFTFFGIVQKGDYKRVIAIFIKESNQQGVYASTIAVPVFEQIAEKMLIHDRII